MALRSLSDTAYSFPFCTAEETKFANPTDGIQRRHDLGGQEPSKRQVQGVCNPASLAVGIL